MALIHKCQETSLIFRYKLRMVYIINIILFLIKGRKINEKQKETFLECQLCTNNDCCFKSCYDLAASSIFCETILGTSQRKETRNVTTLHENCDEAQLPSIKDTHQKSSNY